MLWEQARENQLQVAQILTNSIEKQRLAHAYLFHGMKGTGKKKIGTLFIQSFFCQNLAGAEPCGSCKDCKRIESGNHPDVHMIAPDGLSIKIDQIRHLQKEFHYLGVESLKKAYLIEHAEKMTVQAANSLLKFLEEPGQKTIAVLLTEQPHLILETIKSRCQIIQFSPITPKLLIDSLVEQGTPHYLASIAASLTFDKGEAEKLVNDEWFAQARSKVIQLTEELRKRPDYCFATIQETWLSHFNEKEQLNLGFDLLLLWYKDVLLTQLGEREAIINIDQQVKLSDQALYTSQRKLQQNMRNLMDSKRKLQANVNNQLLMEQTVLRLQEG